MRCVNARGRDSRAAASSSSATAATAPATGGCGRWVVGHGVYADCEIGVYFVVEEELVHAMSPAGSV